MDSCRCVHPKNLEASSRLGSHHISADARAALNVCRAIDSNGEQNPSWIDRRNLGAFDTLRRRLLPLGDQSAAAGARGIIGTTERAESAYSAEGFLFFAARSLTSRATSRCQEHSLGGRKVTLCDSSIPTTYDAPQDCSPCL